MKKYIILLVLFCSAFVYAQTNNTDENDLLSHLKRMNFWKFEADYKVYPHMQDSLEFESELFGRMFYDYIFVHPETMNNGFKGLMNEGLMISDSDDKLLRIYSWDTQLGGTMRFYNNIYQYRSGDKVYSKMIIDTSADGPDPGGWYSFIYTLNTDSKKYYLAVSNSEYSTSEIGQSLQAYSIESNELNNTEKLFKTDDGMSNSLGIGFNLFLADNHPERPMKLFLFSDKKKELSIPVITKKGAVTDKYIIYKFNGKYFAK